MQVVEYKIIVTMLLMFVPSLLLVIKYSTFYHTSVPHHIKSIDIVDVSVLPLSMYCIFVHSDLRPIEHRRLIHVIPSKEILHRTLKSNKLWQQDLFSHFHI